MIAFERIHDIMIDYKSGTVLINGKMVDCSLKLIVKEADGWDKTKLINPEMHKQGMMIPEIIVDAVMYQEMTAKQELKKAVQEAINEISPTKIQN